MRARRERRGPRSPQTVAVHPAAVEVASGGAGEGYWPPHRSKTLRIVHVITRLIIGGAQENTLASVVGLRERHGCDATLLSGPTYGPEGSLEGQALRHPGLLTVVPHLVRPLHPWQDALAWRGLTREFRARACDIVHTHSGKAGLLGRLAARRAGVPHIVHTIHGPSFGAFQSAAANALFRTAEQVAGRVTQRFVVVAEAMRDQYLAAGIGTAAQYQRIFSGFPLQPFLEAQPRPNLRTELQLGPGDFVVGKVARLFKLKGHDDLLETAARLRPRCPQLRLVLVGDGAWRDRLQRKAQALGLTAQVRFVGLVAPDRIPDYLAGMDVLVHLSRREGLPRALPQALAAGKPVIAYDCDGAREVCLPGRTGFLVSPGDQADLARHLEALAADPGLRARLGERGREFVRARFTVEQMVDELHALYAQLLREGCPSPRHKPI